MLLRTTSKTGARGRLSRRNFLSATAVSAGLGVKELRATNDNALQKQRAKDAYRVREAAARAELDAAQPDQASNGDDANLPAKFGNYSKGLPHNQFG